MANGWDGGNRWRQMGKTLCVWEGGGDMANGRDGGSRWQYMGKTLWEEGGGGLTIWQMDEMEVTDRQNLVERRIDKLAMDGMKAVDGDRLAKSCVCEGGGGGD